MTRFSVRGSQALRSLAVRVNLAFVAVALAAVVVCLALGQVSLGLYVVGTAILLVSLSLVVLQQRTAATLVESGRQQDRQFRNVERLVTRAEWRSGEGVRELKAEVRRLDMSDRLDALEARLIAAELLLRRLSDRTEDADRLSSPSERDLEVFLVHLLAETSSKGQ